MWKAKICGISIEEKVIVEVEYTEDGIRRAAKNFGYDLATFNKLTLKEVQDEIKKSWKEVKAAYEKLRTIKWKGTEIRVE